MSKRKALKKISDVTALDRKFCSGKLEVAEYLKQRRRLLHGTK